MKFKYRAQRVLCMTCMGTKRVATLRYGSGPFGNFVGKPLLMTPKEAIAELEKVRAQINEMRRFHRSATVSGLDLSMVENAIRAIGEAGCPTCKGTGSSFEMRQLTPEEARKLR